MEHKDGGIAQAALDPADVGPVQPAFEGKLLLRPAALLTQPSHVCAHLPPDVHAASGPEVSRIGLQTMSLISLDFGAPASHDRGA